jgi:Domain of unknown function (DUF4340)
MKNKSLLIVAFVAAAAAATAAVVISSRSSHESAAKPGPAVAQPLFPGLRDKVNDVARLTLKRGTVDVTVAKSQGEKPAWVVESKGNFPAEFDMIRRAIGGLAEADIVETKTSKPEYYEKIGVGDVDKPGATGTHIEMFDSAGKPLAALIVGTPSRESGPQEPGGSKPRYFVRKDGDPQAYVARGDLSFQPEAMNWLNRTITEVESSKVKSVTVTQSVAGQPQTVRVVKSTPTDQKFQIENMPAGRQLKDDFAANRLGQSFTGAITMDDVMPATGMDFSNPEATVEAALFDGGVITAKMITKDNKKWWAIEARYEEPGAVGAPPTPAPSPAPAPAAPAAGDGPPAAPPPTTSKPGGGEVDEQPEAEAAKPDAQPDQAKDAAAKTEAAKVEAAKAEAAKAQADEKAAATKRVAELNEKCGPWAYVLPEYKVTAMLQKLEDLLKPAETPAPTAPAAAPTPAAPQDQGSLLGPH